MSDERLKQELLYIVRLCEKYNFKDEKVAKTLVENLNDDSMFTSVFGQRFKNRVIGLSNHNEDSRKCIICGRFIAPNGIVCDDCMTRISTSEYAKSEAKKQEDASPKKIIPINKAEKKPAKSAKEIKLPTWKNVVAILVCVLLVLSAAFESWLIHLSREIDEATKLQEPYISEYGTVPVSDEKEAYDVLSQDFNPDIWQIKFIEVTSMYEGYYNVELGQCCDDVEQQITEEERYDFYWGIDVYKYIVTYKDDYIAKMGVIYVDDQGRMISYGSFYDGRNPQKYYRIR